jgi:hypothetical protein
MTPGHEGCLLPSENVTGREADMDGSIRYFSLTLEREEQLKSV